MQLLAFTVAAVSLLVIAYAVGIGGTVGGVIALTVITVGAVLRTAQPLLDKLKP